MRLNILYLAAWYPNRYDNMLGLFIQKHAEATLPFCDISVLYVCADGNLENKKYEMDYTIESGVHELRVYFKKSAVPLYGNLVNAMRYWISFLEGYKFLITKSRKFDLAHVHVLTRCGIFALYLKIFKHIPYIITEHWSRYLPYNIIRGSYKGFLRRRATKIVIRNARAVTTVTENLRDAMQSLGLYNTNYYITPNVVDVHKFEPAEKKKASSVKKIVHVSCFDEKAKNIKGIINVIKHISEKRNDFIIDFIGDGIDFKEVKEYADKTGLVGKIIFFEGLLVDEPLINKMREADFFLLFSNYENLPCTIIESLALGVPVLSTDVGGIREHITPAFGILIEPGNEKQLEDSINDLLNIRGSYVVAPIRNYAIENFSNETLGKKFHQIYMAYLFNKSQN